MNPYEVLIKPLLSEKSNAAREEMKKYSFYVKPSASKEDVKRAISAMFGVKVKSVRTSITRGKMKRRGTKISQASNRKKAIVTLEEGGKIDIFGDLD